MQRSLQNKRLLNLMAAATIWPFLPMSAFAETDNANTKVDAPQKSDVLVLEQVFVTASVSDTTQMQQSLSTSTLDPQRVTESAATNAAEILRVIPGVHSESSGGEGNANLTVRGLPISAGGARYVQLQEDGLPLLQFGDIAFATADQFLRVDSGLDHLEVVRGGSASTMATNSPGGVINFISQTGEVAGGLMGIARGIDFSQTRYDFNYGQPTDTKDMRYFLSGFYRRGESPRDADITTENGGQIKGNLTKRLSKGYVRLSVKHLDDQVPMAMPVPVTTSNGKIKTISGIDPRTASFYSPYWSADPIIDKNNNQKFSDVNDGLHVKSDALGLEAKIDLTNGFSIEEKFRTSDNSGRFIAIFPADNAYSTGPFTVATGPQAGRPYRGQVFTATVFNVSLDDLGNTFNDLNVRKTFMLSEESDLDVIAGLYESTQNIGLTWHFNQYLLSADGSNPVLIANASTSASTSGLIAQGTDVWGGCCTRNIDTEYATTSPYLSGAWFSGAWHVDASIRWDHQKASGTFLKAEDQAFSPANIQFVAYSISETASSLGVNYLLNDDLALFARYSEGHAFNADRIMFNEFALDDTVPIPVNQVEQFEGGAKWRYRDLSAFITYFNADTEETNYEATTQTFTERDYNAQGIELEMAYAWKSFEVHGGITYTDAEIEKAEVASLNGNQPRRQADWVYQLMPAYTMGDVRTGLVFIGTTDAWGDDDNTITMEGYTIVNAFVNYTLDEHTTVALTANNATNKLAYTEVEGDGHAARALDGRSATVGLSYSF